MKELIVILSAATMLVGVLFADASLTVDPVSDSDFKVISSDGTSLWLLDDIDSALAKFHLTSEGIWEHPSNPRLNAFEYSNNDIGLVIYRVWETISVITLKSNAFHLNRGVRVGDSAETIYEKFPEGEILLIRGGLLLIYSSDSEGYYRPSITFEIRDGIIAKITLRSPYD